MRLLLTMAQDRAGGGRAPSIKAGPPKRCNIENRCASAASPMRTRCATSLLHRTRLPLPGRLQRQRVPCNAPRAAATSSNVDDAQLPFALKRVDVQIADWGSVRVVVPASEDEARMPLLRRSWTSTADNYTSNQVLDHYIATNRGDAGVQSVCWQPLTGSDCSRLAQILSSAPSGLRLSRLLKTC